MPLNSAFNLNKVGGKVSEISPCSNIPFYAQIHRDAKQHAYEPKLVA